MATPVEIAVRAVGTAQTGRAISGLDSKTSKLGGTLRTVAKVGALALGGAAIYGAKKLVDFTKAAAEDDAAQSRLAATLKNTTGATDKQVSSVEKWIEKQGKLLGVTDDDLRPALQRMAEGTHSVAKAQDMVSLAMDVSAGTGKSLKSVTEALLRAQNGSIGGLSRYGIATKDAKGETLSLKEVTEGMAETFGGQARKQAETLEGKMDRLKVRLSETGEAIGAKLIPKISDLAGWILDDAIPALSKFWDGLKPTRDAIARATEGIGEVIGAIRKGDWGGAWKKAKEATRDALGTVDRLSRSFFKDKLAPAVRSGLGKVREAWAHQWEQFWKDPDRAYDKVLNHDKVFGDTLIGRGQRTARDYTFMFIRQWQKLPGAAGREGTRTLNAWKQSMQGMPRLATSIGVDVVGGLLRGLNAAPGKARALAVHTAAGLITGLRGAISGAAAIGVAIVGGLISGITSRVEDVASTAASLVTRALNAARTAADAHSPSRKMKKLGKDMTAGLIIGFGDGSAGVARVLGRLTDLIGTTYAARAKAARRRIDNAKAERQALKRLDRAEHARTKSLKKLDNALVANGKAQDANNAALENARGKLKEILDTSRDYAASIREAVTATGDVTTLGKDEAGTATAAGIIDQMTARVQAAKRYADLIATLTKAGLNKTSLQQILAAGVEGGLSTAEALAAGGAKTITEVNRLTGQIVASGTGLGDRAADTMYGAGIKTAEGLVKGLEAKEERIDKVAKRLATTLANAVRRALRVQSPSRVFEDIGKRTVEGLQVGLDDTHVRRSGRKLAASLVDGFSDPKLTATAVLDATTGTGSGAPALEVRFTAEQMDALRQGRAVTGQVQAFDAAGGRRVAKVVRR